jgi:hypothetical protein
MDANDSYREIFQKRFEFGDRAPDGHGLRFVDFAWSFLSSAKRESAHRPATAGNLRGDSSEEAHQKRRRVRSAEFHE